MQTDSRRENMEDGREKEAAAAGLKAKAEEVSEGVTDMIQIARDAANDKVIELLREGNLRTQVLELKVREKPLQSLAIASGVGLALGWLLSKRP